jgi:outer membrane receptor protein involved in Fe transport
MSLSAVSRRTHGPRRRDGSLLFLALLLLTAPLPAVAQTGTATITGRVTDPNGAVIPNATVRLQNVTIGLERTDTTNEEGGYSFTLLQPDTYVISAEATGFSQSVKTVKGLPVGAVLRLNFQLQVTGIGVTRIDVIPDSGDSPDISSVKKTAQLLSLPLKGSNFESLLGLVPSVNFSAQDAIHHDAAGAILGSSSVPNLYIVDGVSVTDALSGGPLLNISNDALQDVRIVIASNDAEFGQSSDIVDAVTKWGTNELHGSGFFYFRDDSLQARGPFGGPVKPSMGQQQFGGTLGGKLRRNTAFFFASVERQRHKGATTTGIRDAVARRIVPAFARTTFFETLVTGKIDLRLGEGDSAFGRYSLDADEGVLPGFSQGGRLQDASNFQSQNSTQQQAMLSWTHSFNTSVSNSARLNYLFSNKSSMPLTTAPQVVFPSLNVGANFLADRNTRQRQFEFKDDVQWILREHSLKFGLNYNRTSLPGPANFHLFGAGLIFVPCDFPGEAGCVSASRDAEIPVTLSLVSQRALTEDGGFVSRGALTPIANDRLGLYVQGSYSFTPNLTLSLGVRWDYDKDYLGTRQTNRSRPGRRSSSKKNVQPRLGIFWRVRGIRIRTGTGLFVEQGNLETRQLELLADGENLPLIRSFNGTLGDPFAGVGPDSPPDIFVTNNELRLPYVFQASAGAEANVRVKEWEGVVSVSAISQRGRRYPRRVELNRLGDGSRLDARFGSVIETQSVMKTATEQLILSYTKLPSDGDFLRSLSFNTSYQLTRATDAANDPLSYVESATAQVPLTFATGPSYFEARHRFDFSGVAPLPKGFELAAAIQAHSSLPFEIIQNHDFSEGVGAGFFRLPTLGPNAGNRQARTGADVNRAIDAFNAIASLVAARGGPLAHVPEDLIFSRPYFRFDLALTNNLQFNERLTLRLGVNVYNVFNRTNILGVSATNPAGLQNNVERPDFGQPLGVTPRGLFGPNAPRSFQFFARFHF